MKNILAILIFIVGAISAVGQDGTVVVFRRSAFTGGALKPSIYVDGSQETRLKNGRYISLQLPAGKHNLSSSMEKAVPLQVEVKANETVYVEMIIVIRQGGQIIPVGVDDAKNAIARLKTQESN